MKALWWALFPVGWILLGLILWAGYAVEKAREVYLDQA